jgi:hypothetical protein
MNCTPSAQLTKDMPEQTSDFAKEGTLAHTLSELLVLQALGRIKPKAYKDQLAAIKANDLYKDEMMEYCCDFRDFVIERYNKAQAEGIEPVLLTETKVPLEKWTGEEGAGGTVDQQIIADGTLEIIDLKYGKGVSVGVEENKQLMLYALGAYDEASHLYDIERVRMTIYQPRIANIESWEMPIGDLLYWADSELKEKARMALEGEGEFVAGDHCKFCKAKGSCRANMERHKEILDRDFSPTLTPSEIGELMLKFKTATEWMEAVEKHAMSLALGGTKIPGFKLVAGRSQRKFTDAEKAAKIAVELGLDESVIYSPRKLAGIGSFEEALGKGVFAEKFDEVVIKPKGAPTLALSSDKREAWSSVDQDFEVLAD